MIYSSPQKQSMEDAPDRLIAMAAATSPAEAAQHMMVPPKSASERPSTLPIACGRADHHAQSPSPAMGAERGSCSERRACSASAPGTTTRAHRRRCPSRSFPPQSR